MKPPTFLLALCVLILSAPIAGADVPLPPNVTDPPTAPEAWNVIRLVTANVERLIKENRLGEIVPQISLFSPALRTLARQGIGTEKAAVLKQQAENAQRYVNIIATASTGGDATTVVRSFESLRSSLREITQHFDPKIVSADIFFCPMHTDFVSVKAADPCGKCAMSLLPRRIPYSFIFTAPGEPSMKMTATASAPLTAGRKAEVKVQLKRRDGSPVLHGDLLVMHTQPIHLLIVDPSLEDYHHEHPVPTETPGEYAFSITPAKSAPYRIWADVVPVSTGVQEYPVVDLPGTGQGTTVTDRAPTVSVVAGGLNFQLRFGSANQLNARQVGFIQITVKEADGKPVQRLEPLMNAFAHLVGFYEDYQTIVHIHPTGGDILRDDVRGGPSMGFQFYPPRPGFLRLFCQVVVDGKMIFAPFNVSIAP